MKYKDPKTGMYKDLYFKTGDTLPVGTIVEYDGDEVPPGYKEVPGTVASVVVSPTEPETGEEVWIDDSHKKIYIKNSDGTYTVFYSEEEIYKEHYSTEEQIIGTWIDGKPLYRKVVHSTDTTNTTVLAHVSDNLDMLYVESGYLYRPNDGLYRGLDYSNCYKYGDNSHEVYLTKGGENWVNFEVYATVCYTKTTD